MHLNGLDLNLLVVLDALFTERNVTRTSERIHLSQSATSAALGRLREFFEDDLLIPVGRKMVLTPRAEGLVQPVHDLILRTKALIGPDSSFDLRQTTRNFKIMMSDYAATVLMPEIVARMEGQAPGVTLEILSLLDSPLSAVERGDIDLLIFPREAVRASHHPCEDLFHENYVCIAWMKNALVGNKMSLKQYLAMGHVGFKSGLQEAPTLDTSAVEKLGYRRRIEVYATAFNLVPELVVGTKRIATVHRRLAIKHAAFLPIKLVEPPIDIPPFTEAIYWHKYRDADLGIRWLRKLIHEAAKVIDATPSPVLALEDSGQAAGPVVTRRRSVPRSKDAAEVG
jgi:LysR family nod box-dependent transcriptional activator